jgi:curved DNA-binding protein CbpA
MELPMASDMGSGEEYRRILRLASGCDPTSMTLSAEEGFLLSRVDGHTPWRLLREIGGMDADEADLCLEGWLATGLVEVAGMAEPPKRERRVEPRTTNPARHLKAPTQPSDPVVIDESLLDESLDIDVEVQRRILEFEGGLDRSYYELLDVSVDADAKQVKKAYFKLSKEFHPDRFFRREIGEYGSRLERIFKKVLEAHEILSDPKLRAEFESSAAAQPAPEPIAVVDDGSEGEAPKAPRRPPRKLTKLERLRARMPFKIPESVAVERRAKAEEFARAAEQSRKMGRHSEAASSLKVAISFDPYSSAYRTMLVELKADAAEAMAEEILSQPGTSVGNESELKEALKAFESVLLYKPHDPQLNHRAATICLEIDEFQKAFEYAQTAVEHVPEVADYHATLGCAYRKQGDFGHAKKEFDKAIELDPENETARKALASLKLGNRSAGQGG